jgi:hypothetical protein
VNTDVKAPIHIEQLGPCVEPQTHDGRVCSQCGWLIGEHTTRADKFRLVWQIAADSVEELLTEAEQLETWADESIRGGWSTHQIDAIRQRAQRLRTWAREWKRRLVMV